MPRAILLLGIIPTSLSSRFGIIPDMALLTAIRFPQYQQTILAIVISTTVLFEVIGPIFTRIALRHTQQ